MSAKILNFSGRKNQAGTFAMIDKAVLAWDIEQKSVWLTLKIWEAYGHYDKEWHDRTISLIPGQVLTTLPALAETSGTSVGKTRLRLKRLEAQGLIFQEIIKGPGGYEGRVITLLKTTDQTTDQTTDHGGSGQLEPQGLQDEAVLKRQTKRQTKSQTNIRQEKEDRRKEDIFSAPLKIDRALEKELKEARAIWSNCFRPKVMPRFFDFIGLNRHAELTHEIYGREAMKMVERYLLAQNGLGAVDFKDARVKVWLEEAKMKLEGER